MKSIQKLLTPKEVAEWLDVSVDWVQSHATRKAPRLPVVRIGKLLRFRNEDVEEFIRGQSPRNRRVLAANGRLTQETRWGEVETA
jgi:excisionase family DNA binding protein